MALLDLRWQRKAKLKATLERPDKFSANRGPETCLNCNKHVGKGSKWRELKWVILDELEHFPSGESIKSKDFMLTAPVVTILDSKCQYCHTVCFSKEAIVKNILDAIDDLPTSI